MKVEKKDLEKSQVELLIELSYKEFEPYIKKGVVKISENIKVEGFRSGKAPLEIIKQRVGEMAILEEAARIAIDKTIREVFEKNLDKQVVGRPHVEITKLAPENPLEYKVVISVLPEVELGKYKGLEIKKEEVKVEKEDVEKTIQYLRESRVKEVIADREAQSDDKVLMDIEMFIDNVPLEGGQSKDTGVILGKDYLVPGFDKKIIGAKRGEAIEFSLPYPKDHYQSNLAGKMVDFKVKIKDVFQRELPEVNDEFAKNLGLKNLEDLNKTLNNNLKEEKEQEVNQKNDNNIIDLIMEKTKVGDLPEDLINHEVESMMTEIKYNIEGQGGKFEDYLSSLNKNRETFALDLTPNAVKRIKAALIIKEIAGTEKISVSMEEVEKKIKEILEKYKGYNKIEERVKEEDYKLKLQNTMASTKVMEKLREWNLV